MIKEYVEKVRSGEIDLISNFEKILAKAKKINEEYHYFNSIPEIIAKEHAKFAKNSGNGCLLGVPLAVKDSIVVEGVESTAGSRILKNYIPKFNATCVKNALSEGGAILGKTSQDEFGFGSFSANIGLDYKTPLNPFDKERCCGGSSGGAAGIAQKADFPLVSYGESTGGSIVNPASFCGVFGLCPSYGRVSRYGLIDYGNSLDKVGPIAKEIEDIAIGLEVMAGYDKKDSTSLEDPVQKYTDYLKKDVKELKIGVIKQGFGEGVDDNVKDAVKDAVSELDKKGCSVSEVSLPFTNKYGVACYYLLSTSEASTNLAKLCGLRYGKHESLEGNYNEYFTKVRSMHFGKEAKRRIILGTFARMAGRRDDFYIRAAKIRTKIIEEYRSLFKEYDVLISPTVPYLPLKFSDINKLSPLQNYMADILTVGPNLAGLPHINIPVGMKNNLPVGMMAISDHLKEGKLIQIGKEFDKKSDG